MAAEDASASNVLEDEPREIRDNVAYRHAELAVLLHASAMQQHEPILKACSYIGVSKLSCLSCAKFIDAYNQQHGTAWATAGTHGKFYQWSFLSETPQSQPQPQQQQSRSDSALPDALGSAAGCFSPSTDA